MLKIVVLSMILIPSVAWSQTLSSEEIIKLKAILGYVQVIEGPINGLKGPHLIVEGINVHIRNAGNKTYSQDGRGNLIIGHNENSDGIRGERKGSHNIVVGPDHQYSTPGNIIGGTANAAVADSLGTAVFGMRNQALSGFSSVMGGTENVAWGECSTIVGGNGNFTDGFLSSVAGGERNSVSGTFSAVSGGFKNLASGRLATVGGGSKNEASGTTATVSGGRRRHAEGTADWRAGGLSEDK